jgi:hypothetical protein
MQKQIVHVVVIEHQASAVLINLGLKSIFVTIVAYTEVSFSPAG